MTTKPTQAQIEAALRDLINRLDFVHNDPAYKSVWVVNQLHVGPYGGPTYTRELEKARSVITAAAEVQMDTISDNTSGMKSNPNVDPALRDFIRDTPYSEPNDGWAAEVGRVRHSSIGPHYLPPLELDDATIERCAQVVKKYIEGLIDPKSQTMSHWDQIRQQCEGYKGSDLPRLNFESLIETIAEDTEAAIRALKEKA